MRKLFKSANASFTSNQLFKQLTKGKHLELPTQKTTLQTDYNKYKYLIYGNPKVGKSTFASKFDQAIFVATEPGHNFLEIFKVDVKTWNDFREFAKAITTKPHPYKTIVVDTVDNLYKMCEQSVLDANKVQHASDLPFGKGFILIKDEFMKVINYLGNSGFGFVFISHAKEKELKTKTTTWTTMTTSLNNQAESFICGLCDFIFYCYLNDKGERLMKTKSEKYINAGSRGFDLPSPMPMDYEQLMKHFKGEKK